MSNLAEKIEQTTIPLDRVRRDGGTQPRAELNEEWAADYAEQMAEGARFPGVVVFYDGSDYWLADGFHRCRAAEISGLAEISADIRTGTRRDAVLYSAGANGQHGHRRTNADKRRAVMMLLEDSEWTRWSDREIARKCGVGNQMVSQLRHSICVNHTDDQRFVRRGDTVYTQNTGNIGQRQAKEPQQPEAANMPIGDAPEQPAPAMPLNEPKHVHVSANSGNNEWYTPPEYIELARAAMGSIDTDPATSEFANKTVNAPLYFTAEDDGRVQEWQGNVWMNPPYAQPLMSDFAEAVTAKYLGGEINQACVLVNNATETAWFQRLMDAATAVAFLRGRVRYLDAQGNPANTPLQGQAIVYMGERVGEFKAAFAERGRVLTNG